jgi:DNA polymerase delta subunit 1
VLSFVTGGDHTRTKAVVTSRVGALSAFTRRKETCLGCKAVLSEVGTPLCKHCAPDEAHLYQQELARFTALEDKFCRLWTECQRCQGSLHEEVLCTRLAIVLYCYINRLVTITAFLVWLYTVLRTVSSI